MMRWWRGLVERVRVLVRRDRFETELDDELRFHLEESTQRNLRRGMSRDEAVRAARRSLGRTDVTKEQVRNETGVRPIHTWLDVSWLDVKLGFRMLIKYPGLTVVGGLGMAVTIAISAGIFQFFSAYLGPLPLDEGKRIVALENRNVVVNNENRQALHDFVAWREEMESVEDLGAFRTINRNLVVSGGPAEPIAIAEITALGFRVARVPPLLGRPLLAEDEREGTPQVLVIGYDVWQTRFAGDPDVVGRSVRIGNTEHTVVGVMPDGFAFPMNHRFWRPLRADPSDYERGQGPAIFIFGRLAPGVTFDQAQAELTAIGRRSAAAFPETHEHLRPQVLPYIYSLIDIQDFSYWQMGLVQLILSLLLVVVSVNVAVLAYARTATRRGEIAVRNALGASRRRIVVQLFVEALVLSAGAAVVGLMLAQVAVRQGNRIMEQEWAGGAPFWLDYGVDLTTGLYALGLTVLAAVIAGVVPGIKATGRGVQSPLTQLSGGSGMRLGGTWTGLIVVQVALTVAVLPTAVSPGLGAIRSGMRQPTFAAAGFLSARLVMDFETPPSAEAEAYGREFRARFRQLQDEVVRRLEAEPGVSGVTYAYRLPGQVQRKVFIEVDGVPPPVGLAPGHEVQREWVGVDFFNVLEVPVLAGRPFGSGDLEPERATVIVNRAFVQQFLGDANAIGRRVRYVRGGFAEPGPWFEIVGVANDLTANPINPEGVDGGVYHPLKPGGVLYPVHLALRVGSTAADFAPRLREITTALDPTLRLYDILPLDKVYRTGQAQIAARLVAWTLALATLSVLFLSAAGVYALTSVTVTQRRREIGIRVALGAHPHRLLGSIFSRTLWQLALGVALGGLAAFPVATNMPLDKFLGVPGVPGAEVLPVIAVLMIAAGLMATVGPARRGLRIPPAEALRET